MHIPNNFRPWKTHIGRHRKLCISLLNSVIYYCSTNCVYNQSCEDSFKSSNKPFVNAWTSDALKLIFYQNIETKIKVLFSLKTKPENRGWVIKLSKLGTVICAVVCTKQTLTWLKSISGETLIKCHCFSQWCRPTKTILDEIPVHHCLIPDLSNTTDIVLFFFFWNCSHYSS